MAEVSDVGPKLLESIGVNTVVYVDDLFGVDDDRLCAALDSIDDACLSDASRILGVDETVDDMAVLRAKLKKAIKNIDTDRFQDLHRSLSELNAGDEDRLDYAAAQALRQALGPKVDYQFLSLADWNAQRESLLGAEKARTTLFIFDEAFVHEGGSEVKGRELIEAVHAELDPAISCLALLTHKATDEASEDALRNEIVAEREKLRDVLVVIGKNRLLENDGREFSSKLKLALLSRRFDALRGTLEKALADAQAKAQDQIQDFTVELFEQIVFRTSAHEGAWVPETVIRLLGISQAKHARETLRADVDVHRLVNETHGICEVETEKPSDSCVQASLRLQRNEIYDQDTDVNSLHLGTWLGDMFQKSPGSKTFILLAQPCELMVRTNGMRAPDTNLDRQQMAALVETRRVTGPLRDGQEVLLHYDENGAEVWVVDFTRVCHLPRWVLDLAVLNEDGACKICHNQYQPAILVPAWQTRMEHLKAYAEEIAHQLRSIDVKDIPANIASALARIPCGSPFGIEIVTGNRNRANEWKISAKLMRIGRMRDPYAAAILSRFGAHLTRAAFPHDLTVQPSANPH